jgi:hypothetical protein
MAAVRGSLAPDPITAPRDQEGCVDRRLPSSTTALPSSVTVAIAPHSQGCMGGSRGRGRHIREEGLGRQRKGARAPLPRKVPGAGGWEGGHQRSREVMEVHVDGNTEQSRGGLHALTSSGSPCPQFHLILNLHGDLSIWSSVWIMELQS